MGVLDLVPNDKADKIRSRRYGRRRSAANPVYSGGIYVSSAEPDNTKRLLPPELLGFVDIPTKRPRGDKFCFRLKKMKHFPVMKRHFLGFCIKRVDLMFLSFHPVTLKWRHHAGRPRGSGKNSNSSFQNTPQVGSTEVREEVAKILESSRPSTSRDLPSPAKRVKRRTSNGQVGSFESKWHETFNRIDKILLQMELRCFNHQY